MVVTWRKPSRAGVRSAIFQQSLDAARLWIDAEWKRRIIKPALTVVYSASLDYGDRQAALESGKPEGMRGAHLPWCAMSVVNIQERSAGPYSPWVTQKYGLPVGKINNRMNSLFEYVRPVDVGIALRFRCLDVNEAYAFASMWMENRPSVCVDIANDDSNARVRITMELDNNCPIPPHNSSANNTATDIETTMICRTYMGVHEMVTNIRSLNVNLRGEYGIDDGVQRSPDTGLAPVEKGTYLYSVRFEGDRHMVIVPRAQTETE